VTLWETVTRQRRTDFKAHEFIIQAVAFSPKGRLLASCCQGGTLVVRDIYSGKEVLSVKSKGGFCSLSFSPDGRLLATTVGDNQVKLWDMTTSKEYVPEKEED
jgi:WD40 repeat protein